MLSNCLKLYEAKGSPNSRRVRIFLAEKGVSVNMIPVDLGEKEQFSDAYIKINPRRVVPTLVLEDGTALGEVPAILRYIEEAYPKTPLLGTTAKDKALVTMWERRMELEGFAAVMETVRNNAAGLKGRAIAGTHDYEQIPGLVDRGRRRVADFYADLDERLRDVTFIAGDQFSVADITAIVAVDFATKALGMQIPEEGIASKRWYDIVSVRPEHERLKSGIRQIAVSPIIKSRKTLMSAYIVVELTVKNVEAKDRYSAAAAPVLREHGGEIISGGAWTVLIGEATFASGAIIRFSDRDAALAWYNSPGYQATLMDRAEGIDCRFRLLG